MKNIEYILEVGKKGKDRLNILHQVFRQSSEALLLKAGISKGQTILELGCGTGNMTCWLAQQVGDNGHIYAVDISKQQINIANERASKQRLKNITFIHASALDMNLPITFDLIYTRLVLMHIAKPLDALKIMYKHLNDDGAMVCEEACNAIYCHPPSSAYLKSRELIIKMAELKNVDFNIGEKLYGYFIAMALQVDFVNFIQPIYKTRQEKLLVPFFIEEAKSNYIAYGLASETEVDQLCKDIYNYIDNETNLMSFPRVMQIIGNKKN